MSTRTWWLTAGIAYPFVVGVAASLAAVVLAGIWNLLLAQSSLDAELYLSLGACVVAVLAAYLLFRSARDRGASDRLWIISVAWGVGIFAASTLAALWVEPQMALLRALDVGMSGAAFYLVGVIGAWLGMRRRSS